MTNSKKDKKKALENNAKLDTLWRKPITLDSLEAEDPLAVLYKGREVGGNVSEKADEISTDEPEKQFAAERKSVKNTLKKPVENENKPSDFSKTEVKEKSETAEDKTESEKNKTAEIHQTKVSEEELKTILKIKGDSFEFTDIREILRGKSFEIYAFLRVLAGDSGVCKIRHLDLMQKLDVSRPTLFKQGDWLTRLSLIEKRSVPGDHLGTSYVVNRLEDILPVPAALIDQLQTYIESLRREME